MVGLTAETVRVMTIQNHSIKTIIHFLTLLFFCLLPWNQNEETILNRRCCRRGRRHKCGWGGGKGARAVAVCRRAVEITLQSTPYMYSVRIQNTMEYSVRSRADSFEPGSMVMLLAMDRLLLDDSHPN